MQNAEKTGLGENQTIDKNATLNITRKQVIISFYKIVTDNQVTNELELDKILECIKSDPLSQLRLALRAGLIFRMIGVKTHFLSYDIYCRITNLGIGFFQSPVVFQSSVNSSCVVEVHV